MRNGLRPIRGITAFRKFLRRAADAAPSYEAFAKAHGITRTHLSNILNSYSCIGVDTAARFGYDLVPGEPLFVPREKAK